MVGKMNDNQLLIATALKNNILLSKQIAEDTGLSGNVIGGHLTKMRQENLIEQLDDKTYALTDFGRIHFDLKSKLEIKEPEKVVVEPKKIEIVKHDAPIQYTPINEKTVNEIKNHVNGTTPDYYKGKSIQVFDILDEFLTPEANQGFYVGNIIKYVVRFRGKAGKQDLLKARDYLDKLIDSMI